MYLPTPNSMNKNRGTKGMDLNYSKHENPNICEESLGYGRLIGLTLQPGQEDN